MVNAVENDNRKNPSGSKKWRYTVNETTGRKAKYDSLNIHPSVINSYFQIISTDVCDDNDTLSELGTMPNGTGIPNVDVPLLKEF